MLQMQVRFVCLRLGGGDMVPEDCGKERGGRSAVGAARAARNSVGIRLGEEIEGQRHLHLKQFPSWCQVVPVPELAVGPDAVAPGSLEY